MARAIPASSVLEGEGAVPTAADELSAAIISGAVKSSISRRKTRGRQISKRAKTVHFAQPKAQHKKQQATLEKLSAKIQRDAKAAQVVVRGGIRKLRASNRVVSSRKPNSRRIIDKLTGTKAAAIEVGTAYADDPPANDEEFQQTVPVSRINLSNNGIALMTVNAQIQAEAAQALLMIAEWFEVRRVEVVS